MLPTTFLQSGKPWLQVRLPYHGPDFQLLRLQLQVFAVWSAWDRDQGPVCHPGRRGDHHPIPDFDFGFEEEEGEV